MILLTGAGGASEFLCHVLILFVFTGAYSLDQMSDDEDVPGGSVSNKPMSL